MPSTASVQTTIAPSIAALVRKGMIAIAVGRSPVTRRRLSPKPACHGPTHGPDPTRSAQPAVSPVGNGAVDPDPDVNGHVASEGHGLAGCIERDDHCARQPAHPAQLIADRLGRSLRTPELFEMAQGGRLLGPFLLTVGQELGGRSPPGP